MLNRPAAAGEPSLTSLSPAGAPTLRITETELAVQGQRVVTLKPGGDLPDDAKGDGYEFPPVRKSLAEALHATGSQHVTLELSGETTQGMLVRLMFTAKQAGFTRYAIRLVEAGEAIITALG